MFRIVQAAWFSWAESEVVFVLSPKFSALRPGKLHMRQKVIIRMVSASDRSHQARPYSSWRLFIFSSRGWQHVVSLSAGCTRKRGGESCTNYSSFTKSLSPSQRSLTFVSPPGDTKFVINRQFIPLEVIDFGCTKVLTSRQSASLDWLRQVLPGRAFPITRYIEHIVTTTERLFLSLLF
jgi:hypothetical protein